MVTVYDYLEGLMSLKVIQPRLNSAPQNWSVVADDAGTTSNLPCLPILDFLHFHENAHSNGSQFKTTALFREQITAPENLTTFGSAIRSTNVISCSNLYSIFLWNNTLQERAKIIQLYIQNNFPIIKTKLPFSQVKSAHISTQNL